MTASELADIRQFRVDMIAEYERNRNAPPPDFSAEDLDSACSAIILAGTSRPSQIGEPPDPRIKAANNHFTERAIEIIEDYRKYEYEIGDFIQSRALDVEDFPERVRDSFLNVYRDLSGGNIPLFGDDLFFGLIRRLTKDRPAHKSAIEALLVYYFVRCEVFPWHPGESEEGLL